MKKAILIASIIFLFCNTSMADPSKTVKYLMNEPITMLDWCCYRMGKVIEEMDFSHFLFTDPAFDVQYDWNSNLIVVSIYCSINSGDLEYLKPRDHSRKIVDRIKSEFLYVRKISGFLGHKGYKRQPEPASLIEDVEKIIKISVSIVSARIICESLLKSNEYSYQFPEK